MKDIISSELYKLKNRRKHKLALGVSVLAIVLFCMHFLIYKNVGVTDFLFFYLPKVYAFIIALAVLYNYFFQEEYQYNTQKNLIWIMRNRKSIFLGKFIVQLVILTINYLSICLVLFLFMIIKSNDFSEIKSLLLIIFGFYFVLIRAMILFDLFTIIWKNDYVTFVMHWCAVNFAGLLVGMLESLIKIGEVISLHTIQGQLSNVFITAVDGNGFATSIIVNILLSLIGLCICILIYKMNNKK